MPTNETIVEVLRIQATGLDETSARLHVYAQQVEEVERRQKALQGLINDPAYAKHAERIEATTRAYQQGETLLRNRQYAIAAENGQLQRQATVMNALNHSYDLMVGKVQSQVMASNLASGAYQNQVTALTAVSRQNQVLTAQGNNQVMAADLASGAYGKQAAVMGSIERQQQIMAAQGRNLTAQADLESGATLRQTAAMTALNRQYGLIQSRGKIQILSDDLKSGAFLKHAVALAAFNKQMGQLQGQAQLQQLVAECGRLGGVLRANASEYTLLRNTATGGYQQVRGFTMGLMSLGLNNSVEGYRLSASWERMGRQIAAIAIPAIDKVSAAIGHVAGWFERLSGPSQDFLLKIGLFAVAFGPVVASLTRVYALMKAISTLSMAGFAVSGLRVAATSTAMNMAALSSASIPLATGLGVAAGATSRFAGARALALPVAAGGAAGAMGYGSEAIGLGAGLGYFRGGMGGAARLATPIAVGAAVTNAATGGYWTASRARGDSMLNAAWKALGSSAVELAAGFVGEGDRFKKFALRTLDPVGSAAAAAAERARRDVSPMNVGLTDARSHHQQIQEEVLKFYAARGSGREVVGEKTLTEIWLLINDFIKKWTEGRPPLSTG